MSLESVVASLKALSIPSERPAVSTNTLLGIVAAKYLETTSSSLEALGGSSPEEPWWSYVLCCLDCLDKLCRAVKARTDDTPALSAHQMSLLRDRLEFVVALGLAPHLDPGVGLPISARICSAEQFLQPRQGFHSERVQLIVKRLMALYEEPELRVALLPKFLHDLLVGLITLSFHPKCDPQLRRRYQARLRRVTTSGLPGRREIVREVFVIQSASDQKSSLTPAPAWLRFACSQILSKQVKNSSDGVLPLVLGFFDFAGRHGREVEKCCTLARVLSCPPMNATGEKLSSHWRNICSQILACLQSQSDPLVLRFGIAFTDIFAASNPSTAQDLLLDPFFRFSDTSGPISADDLELLFVRMERFVVNCFDPGPLICSNLLRHFDLLFYAFAATITREPPWRDSVLSSICSLLKLRETLLTVENWTALLLDSPRDSVRQFVDTEDGRLAVKNSLLDLGPSTRFGVPVDEVMEAVITILQKMPPDFQGLMFIELLRRLRLFLMREVETEAEVITPSLRPQNQPRADLLMGLLVLISDKFPECFLQRKEMIVELAKETMTRCLFIANNTEEFTTQMFTTEAISISLTLLSSILMSRDGLREDGETSVTDALNSALSVVSELKNRHPSGLLRDMASEVHVAMATRGYVASEAVKAAAAAATGGAAARPLVEEVEGTEIGRAVREAGDAEIPVQGHGLLVLARAVEAQCPEVNEHYETVLQRFIDGVTHEDSFVYLPAIRGLAAMASERPTRLLPLLLREFADSRLDGEAGGDQRAEFRLKVGEAIVRCVRALGEAAVQHRDQLLNVLLSRCRLEARDFLRAAALSNLAEVCRLLRFALHTCLHEILTTAAALLAMDNSAEVRKAAAFLLLSLLRGADRQLLQICGGEGLKATYRVLRRRAAAEDDERVRRMVLLACNELDDLVRAQIFPEEGKMEKHIRIL